MTGAGLGRAGRFLALGFEFGGAVVGGLAVGYYADAWLGTGPLFLVVLTVLALAGAVWRLLLVLRRLDAAGGPEGGAGGG